MFCRDFMPVRVADDCAFRVDEEDVRGFVVDMRAFFLDLLDVIQISVRVHEFWGSDAAERADVVHNAVKRTILPWN